LFDKIEWLRGYIWASWVTDLGTRQAVYLRLRQLSVPDGFKLVVDNKLIEVSLLLHEKRKADDILREIYGYCPGIIQFADGLVDVYRKHGYVTSREAIIDTMRGSLHDSDS
jgi:hypothetical protein